MKRTQSLIFVWGLVLGFAVPGLMWGQEQRCVVRIAVPKNGSSVAGDGLVSGTASIPASKYLWVLAHREGLALWWPEGGGSATVVGGSWKALVTYGVDRDISYRFEVATAVVDEGTNERLAAWVKKTAETGQYSGIEFPSTVEGCAIEKITVTREK